MIIRYAAPQDVPQMLLIYEPYIADSAITFETVVPARTEFENRLKIVINGFPWLICEEEGIILGYAYSAKHRDRIAYQWSVESSVYVSPDAQGRGVAKHLYQAMIAILKIQGIVNIYALITVPNSKSICLHERLGFSEFALFNKIGYKNSSWHDVLWMVLVINSHEKEQSNPLLFSDLRSDVRVLEIIRKETILLNQ